VVSLGDGDDTYDAQDFSRRPLAEPDVVDLGPGDDHARIGPEFAPRACVVGGVGDDDLSLYLPPHGSFVVDAATGEVRQGRAVRLRFDAFDSYSAGSLDTRTPWRFVGTPGPDRVDADSRGLRAASLGRGADELVLDASSGTGHRPVDVRGGGGRDSITVRGDKTVPVMLDLRRGRLDLLHGTLTGRVVGFEDASADGSVVDLVGTGRGNQLTVRSCRAASVRGLGGDDLLSVVPLPYRSCQGTAARVASGGAGDDTLTGGPGRQRLDGGRGHDTADGGPGRDTCVSVETATDCERHA
jgi:Ca2+-binding RTX toxin-like protein